MSKEHTTVTDSALDDCDLVYTPVKSIGGIVDELRTSFDGGTLREVSERKRHLRALLKGLRAEEKRLLAAVRNDLNKSEDETYMYELSPV
ncbi:hypothetical protein GGI11_002215, partial [Coemansia sp. RSA 2049]